MSPSSPSPKALDEKLGRTEVSLKSEADTLNSDNYESRREKTRISNPQGMTSPHPGVNVEKAEQDFSELSRQFSNISHHARRLSKQISSVSKTAAAAEDVEKSGSSADSEERWDLESALRGNRAAEEEAGIRDKHIGNSFCCSFS